MTSLDKSLLDEFESIVGASHALHEDELVASYSTDWTGRFKGSTPLVLRPGTTEEVAQILRVASDANVALVPQGGNTGLVGGSVPLRGEVVLSLLRLNVCEPVDVLAQQVSLGAGVTLAQAQNHVSPFNLAIGVDLAARDSCTIGGMIATNAGGINVVRYGPMRDQLLGVEAVTADGSSISHLEGLEKDNTGYHLPGLFAGSEGSLAVITKARLRLHPQLDERCSAMLAFKSVGDAVSATAQLRRSVPDLHAVEVIFREAMDLVSDYISTSIPVRSDGSAWLIVEAASSSDPTDQLAQAIGDLGDLVLDVAVGHDSTSRAGLWQFREKITEAIATRGTPHKLDVTLPASELAEFVSRIPEIISEVDRRATAVMFGHLGDGNVHVNVLGDDGLEPDNEVESAVLGYVAQLGGSISAEHGIGTAKKEFLHLNRSGQEIAIFRAIKSSFDPKGILSPNTLIPAEEQ
ncbi:MAG TPA: FAD-binding oxidoreductase [Acidimicrobiaceae bacterium]|nr:FAD-binding oxidoreductase [Acidimicrobiaceae bacterium]|tara:strand:+ start:9614 stop:11002 length:1389 start_codon:yes stop_codon:yes gene_type:complete